MATQSPASVTRLPTAAPTKVQQAPRRGRMPKCIPTLAEARRRSHRLQLAAEYQKEAESLEDTARCFARQRDRHLKEAAALREKITFLVGGMHHAA